MKLMTRLALLSMIGVLGLAKTTQAVPIVIDFDGLASGVVVGATYAGLGVTFVDAETAPFGGLPGGTPPMAIVHDAFFSTYGQGTPIAALFASDVSAVSIVGIDVGAAGIILKGFDALVGGSLVASDSFTGVGIGVGAFHPLSISGAGIRRIEFSQILPDFADGVAFDTLSFEATSVPEPGTITLVGLGLLGAARRLRKARRS
jgi:hypothetical protein